MRVFWLGSAVILVILTALIIRSTQQAFTQQAQVQHALTPGGQTKLYGKALLETITLGAYDGASTEVAAIEDHIAAWQQAQRVTRLTTGSFILLSILLLGSVLVYGRTHAITLTWRILSAHTLGLSALLFVLGITTPLVTVTVTGRLPGLGSTLIQATTKGVLAAIGDLWSTQPGLALLVTVFSVVLPVSKLGLAGWVLARDRPAHPSIRLLEVVGKWAMADVLVVAVLIVLLSPLRPESLVQTHAQPRMGLAFFAASCLLSMLTTLMVGRSGAAQIPAPGPAPRLLGAGDDA
jgi:hypothetical protein